MERKARARRAYRLLSRYVVKVPSFYEAGRTHNLPWVLPIWVDRARLPRWSPVGIYPTFTHLYQ